MPRRMTSNTVPNANANVLRRKTDLISFIFLANEYRTKRSLKKRRLNPAKRQSKPAISGLNYTGSIDAQVFALIDRKKTIGGRTGKCMQLMRFLEYLNLMLQTEEHLPLHFHALSLHSAPFYTRTFSNESLARHSLLNLGLQCAVLFFLFKPKRQKKLKTRHLCRYSISKIYNLNVS